MGKGMGRSLRARGAKGQTLVEFSIAGVLFLAFLLAVVSLSVSSWARSSVDFSMSELATQLPAGWDTMDKATLVKRLVTNDGEAAIDPDRLTVDSASITEVTTPTSDRTHEGDAIAGALGGTRSYTSGTWVRVRATVTYKVDAGGMILAGTSPAPYTRTIDRIYLTDRRYEVS